MHTCFWTMVLEKSLENPLDRKEIKPVNPKGNQPWIFIGRTGADIEALLLWPLDVKSGLTGKDPDAGKDWEQEEKGVTEDEMVGWHHESWWTWVWENSGRQWRTGKLSHAAVHGIAKGIIWVTDWTSVTMQKQIFLSSFLFPRDCIAQDLTY